jgi:hypothetical protein
MFADWLPRLILGRWRRRHRLRVVAAGVSLTDGAIGPSINVRNVGRVPVVVQQVGGRQGHVQFLVPDERLPLELPPDRVWVSFAMVMEPPLVPDDPWTAVVAEPNGHRHVST